MFFDNYKKLCESHGEKPYQLPLKLGAKSNSMVAQWQKGSVPRYDMLEKIASHFGISVQSLLYGEEDIKKQPADGELTNIQKEAWQLLQTMTDDQLRAFIAGAKAMLGK